MCCQLELAVAKHYKRWSLSLHWNHCQILPDFLRNPGIVTFDDTQFGFIKREKVGAGSHEMLGRAGEAWNIPNHWAGLILGEILDKRHNKLRSADLPSYPHTAPSVASGHHFPVMKWILSEPTDKCSSDTRPDLAPGAGWQRVQSWAWVYLISRYQVQILSDTDKVIALFRLWIFCCDHWPLTCEVKLSDFLEWDVRWVECGPGAWVCVRAWNEPSRSLKFE